ncbi:PQQ-dependent sugar dehydrogenase [Croceicoccus sp. Ery15]|uniref:PQQ-dependent sugar dehydrogenase n=1 Tax=Croceicoccus sp. Ery15 TaxID=1703338 RepID=UPI001E319F47|nr:PQQ-dependent sugar dehydrogenase [Croceicoccus sp. Ery15]
MKSHSLRFASIALASLAASSLASCQETPTPATGGEAGNAAMQVSFAKQDMGTFDEPWAIAFEPGTGTLFVTEKSGAIRFRKADGTTGDVSGVPDVDYGGQGGLGDIVFAPDYASSHAVYISYAEAGSGDTRGAAVMRATLQCDQAEACALRDPRVIWRQDEKVTGRGHYSHRIAFSPDGDFLFIASGDRQKMQPAQDLSNNLGTIVRLLPDGSPAPGNPFTGEANANSQIWSYGHRNILGLAFDARGQLWDLEHGPQGGDELNLVARGMNYGWPNVSNGIHYDNKPIPDHAPGDGYVAPVEWWDPVIAPGGMIFYSGALFPDWQGNALIAGLGSQGLVVVKMDGKTASESARYDLGVRIRAVAEAADGSVWVAEDGPDAHVWRLTPQG